MHLSSKLLHTNTAVVCINVVKQKTKIMKALKVLAVVLLASFTYTAASAQVHHRRHYKKHHRHVVVRHHHM
jgi:hypothetical protein